MEKYGKARRATDDNVMLHRKNTICTLDNLGKNTLTSLIIFNALLSAATVVTLMRLSVTLYVHCRSCFPFPFFKQFSGV